MSVILVYWAYVRKAWICLWAVVYGTLIITVVQGSKHHVCLSWETVIPDLKKSMDYNGWEKPKGETSKPVYFYYNDGYRSWSMWPLTEIAKNLIVRKESNEFRIGLAWQWPVELQRSLCGNHCLHNSSVTLESAVTHPRSSSGSRLAPGKKDLTVHDRLCIHLLIADPWSLINQIKGFQQWQIALQSQW